MTGENKARLLALAERCEKASEGNRELDRDIHWIGLMGYTHLHDDHFLDPNSGTSGCYKVGGSPKYSTSLDAAMTLVPEGYAVTDMSVWPGERSSCVVIGTKLRPFGKDRRMSWVHASGDGKYCGDGTAPPLALLAAILRARQAMQMEVHHER